MLTADYLDAFPDPIVALYRQLEDTVIQDIARRLAGMDYARPTAAWQMQRMTESGALYNDVLEQIAAIDGRSTEVLGRMFEDAGVKSMAFDDSIYEAAGLDPLPLNLSPAMAQTLSAGLQKTRGVMRNLTLSTAFDTQQSFVSAADLAYMQITSGTFDYNTAIKHAIKRAADDGLFVRYPSGHRDHLDVAMRRTVLTGVSQTAAQLQLNRADELGVDLVQTSAHIGARPSHQEWQGKVFSRSGNHEKYPPLVSSTGFGTGAGLAGYNCRHSMYPFFEGISENAYKQAELNSFANKKVTYNGEQMSIYDATQEQRAIERYIRKHKRRADALQAAGQDNAQELVRVRRGQQEMRSFIKQTGLQRQSVREQINGGKTRIPVSRSSRPLGDASKVTLPRTTPQPDAYDLDIAQNQRSYARAANITPAMLDAGEGGSLAEYMYNFFAYDDSGNPVFSAPLLSKAKNDLLYNVYTMGKGRVSASVMHPIREKAGAILGGHDQLGGKVLSLKERRILERLASAEDDTVFDEIDKVRDQRLKGRLQSGSYGSSGSTEPKFTSAEEEDAIKRLRENKPGWKQ